MISLSLFYPVDLVVFIALVALVARIGQVSFDNICDRIDAHDLDDANALVNHVNPAVFVSTPLSKGIS